MSTLHQQILKNKKSEDRYCDVMVYLLQNRRKTIIFPKDDEFVRDFTTKSVYSMRAKNRSYIFDRLENGSSKVRNNVIDYIHEEWLHTIANLTLTGYNSRYSNRTFVEKKSVENGFAQSGLRLNQYIAKFDRWTEEEMKLRRDNLAEMAVKIWAYPETSYTMDVHLDDEVPIGDEDFNFTNRKITSFRLLGTQYLVNDWVGATIMILQLLYELDPKLLIAEAKNPSDVWIVPNDSGGRYPRKQITDDVWICVTNDTNTKVRIIRNIYLKFDLADDDLIFTLVPEKENND